MKIFCFITSLLISLFMGGCSSATQDAPVVTSIAESVRTECTETIRLNTVPVKIPVTVEKKVYVEKPLSSWQKVRINSFWFLLAALSGSLIYIFRKPLLRLMCRLKL